MGFLLVIRTFMFLCSQIYQSLPILISGFAILLGKTSFQKKRKKIRTLYLASGKKVHLKWLRNKEN